MAAPAQFRNEFPEGALEVRSLPGIAEARAADDGSPPRIAGLGSVYGQRVTLGWWFEWDEEVMPGAWSATISKDGADIRSMFNHDPNRLLGRTTAGTLRLSDTADGLRYEVDVNPDDANAMSVWAQVERGDVSGASVWFRVTREQWTEPTDDNGLERPLRQIFEAELFEVGPVVFPAFPTTTASAARSLDSMLRGAGVTKSSRRARLTADLLSDPDGIESRIAEILARQPELREQVCATAQAAAAAADDPERSAPSGDAVPVESPPRSHLLTVRQKQLLLRKEMAHE